MKCDKCKNKAYCDEHVGIRRICKRNGYNGFAMYTNADRIRAMSDEELAETIVHTYGNGGVCPPNHKNLYCSLDGVCDKCWLAWLKEEVTE